MADAPWTPEDQAKLDRSFEAFRTLNPEISAQHDAVLIRLAEKAPERVYPAVLALLEELLEGYLASPVKQAEHAVLREFYYFMDRLVAKRLGTAPAKAAAGEGAEAEAAAADGTGGPTSSTEIVKATVSMVPDRLYNSAMWCELTTKSAIPEEILAAVNAAQLRNTLVDSVLEPLLSLLVRLRPEEALRYQLAMATAKDPVVDPDVARDLLRVWRRQPALPPEILRHALAWAGDELTVRHWPQVSLEADRLTRRFALLAWAETRPRIGEAVRLAMLTPFTDDDRLRRWLSATVGSLGASVDFFCAQSERLTAKPGEGAATVGEAESEANDWRRAGLYRELLWLSHMMPMILVMSDLLLTMPYGTRQFALAVFGFTAESRQTWRQHLEAQSAKLVSRVFLYDLKAGRSPANTIRKLCFGDEGMAKQLIGELDLVSETFDSLAQRQLVVDRLAPVYASTKESSLMAVEIGRRYRRIMRVLHDDNLRRVLTAEQLADLEPRRETLLELSTIASTCRRFLSSRNALDRSTEELLAEEMDFGQTMRNLRVGYLRSLMDL